MLEEEDLGAAAADDALAEHRPGLGLVFSMYAAFGLHGEAARAAPELDSFRCTKLAREAGLLDGSLTTQALDVLFAAAKGRGARRWGQLGAPGRGDWGGGSRRLCLADCHPWQAATGADRCRQVGGRLMGAHPGPQL